MPLALKPLTIFFTLLLDMLSHTVNGTTYAGIRARTTGPKALDCFSLLSLLSLLPDVLSHTVNGTTYAGIRARTTGAPQNHW